MAPESLEKSWVERAMPAIPGDPFQIAKYGLVGISGPDWTSDPGLSRMTPFLETKTVWHPMGV